MIPGRTAATFSPPIMAAQDWLRGVTFPPDRPLINVSQAAPVGAPPLALREAMAALVRDDPDIHLYGPVPGLPALRAALAAKWSLGGGHVVPGEVAITSGCNQAYAAAMTVLSDAGCEVILPVPFYFNHRMWNDMAGLVTRPLPTGPDLLPDPGRAAAMITSRTRAIVLISPNNPCGTEYPPELVGAFFDLAREAGIALVIDETYRDFDARPGPPHDLFARPGWQDTLIQLYSFSKAYRLTGHRVGAMTAGAGLIGEAEKFLDTVAICPNQLGQRAALWGMEHLDDWLADERAEILARRAAIAEGFPRIEAQGWRLLGLGAYFAYVEHPFAIASDALAPRLVRDAGLLLLPGTMFMPDDVPGGGNQLRIAFANIDRSDISALFDRLAALDYPRRGATLAEPPPGQ